MKHEYLGTGLFVFENQIKNVNEEYFVLNALNVSLGRRVLDKCSF